MKANIRQHILSHKYAVRLLNVCMRLKDIHILIPKQFEFGQLSISVMFQVSSSLVPIEF